MRVGISDMIVLMMAMCLSSNIIITIMTIICKLLQNRVSMRCLDKILKGIILYFLLLQPIIAGVILYKAAFRGKLVADSEDYRYYYLIGEKTFHLVHEKTYLAAFFLVFLIWIIGFILIGVWRFFSIQLVVGKLEKYGELLFDCVHEGRREGWLNRTVFRYRIYLYQSDAVPTPFMKGLFTVKIFIPKKGFDEKEKELILEHEFKHCESFDYFYRLIFFVLCSVFWFNPFIYYMADYFVSVNEIACDERVLFGKSKEACYLYAQLMCRLTAEGGLNARYITNFTGNQEHILVRRLKNMRRPEEKGGLPVLAAVLAGAFFLCPVSTWAAAKGMSEIQNIVVQTIIEGNRVEEASAGDEWEEASDFPKIDKKNISALQINSQGSSNVDISLEKNKIAITDSIWLTKGSKVHFGLKSSASTIYLAGIIDESGKSRYITAKNGETDYTFTVQADGGYDIFIENVSFLQMDISGIIYILN